MNTEAKPAQGESVRCVIIPLDGGALLLPNASVAEVVSYQAGEAVASAPPWCLGRFQWRGVRVPLISFERFIGETLGDIGHRARIIVIYGLGEGRDKAPYFGVLAQGIPRLSRVAADGIQPAEEGNSHEAIAARVLVDGVKAWIPDVDKLTGLIETLAD
ncbi:MAG: chemotaxis protein CheW [Gammaproteobacteria bacterium]|nr:chemotaxis protein CheW [Gammaproteobacteria bacterium]MBU1654871.1 chemotaxis protein CheW [Gammaproteobacteria bacterium]MBU1961162.1 chemotaxis protein CheW [Gammaproteobacteria bacterium]